MITASDRRLLVFARRPQSGRVKTRLIPALGAAGAAILYRHLLETTLARAAGVPGVSRALWCDAANDDHGECARLASAFGMTLHHQQGPDLGARMHHALDAGLRTAHQAVLIGTDCPEIGTDYLAQAFGALERHDAVLGPAVDGGYILVGLREPDPRLFVGIPWGTGRVLETTRVRLRQLNRRWLELPALRDIDRPSDLRHFPELAEGILPPTPNLPA